jgi:hypothetical protein
LEQIVMFGTRAGQQQDTLTVIRQFGHGLHQPVEFGIQGWNATRRDNGSQYKPPALLKARVLFVGQPQV